MLAVVQQTYNREDQFQVSCASMFDAVRYKKVNPVDRTKPFAVLGSYKQVLLSLLDAVTLPGEMNVHHCSSIFLHL